MPEFEFLSPSDKPALLAISTPEWQGMAQAALVELGYKVHIINGADEFLPRWAQVQYQVCIIEYGFAGAEPGENMALRQLQWLPMMQRRHCTTFLLGDVFETLNAMQAYQQSVHGVLNYSEMAILNQLIQKVVLDNESFLNSYRDVGARLAKGKG